MSLESLNNSAESHNEKIIVALKEQQRNFVSDLGDVDPSEIRPELITLSETLLRYREGEAIDEVGFYDGLRQVSLAEDRTPSEVKLVEFLNVHSGDIWIKVLRREHESQQDI